MDLIFIENEFVVVWTARDIYGVSNAMPAASSEANGSGNYSQASNSYVAPKKTPRQTSKLSINRVLPNLAAPSTTRGSAQVSVMGDKSCWRRRVR